VIAVQFFQPMIKMNLIEVSGDHFLAQLMSSGAQERDLEAGQHSNQPSPKG